MGRDGGTVTTVRVGIVSWNTAELLDRCLAALPDALGGLDAEVVVVDNGSSDASADIARGHAGVRVEAVGENLGYARGMNRALGGTGAEVLVALNPDTEPGTGTLRALIERLLADPRAGCVAPRLVHPDGSLQHSVHRFPSLRLAAAANLLPVPLLRGRLGRRLWIEGCADHRSSGPVDWAIGAVHVLRTAAVGERPYSERWFMYVEDLDLCWRLRTTGWDVVLAGDVEVVHVGNAAGAQQWGEARTGRWLDATYDWYATARGPLTARTYAALNLAGATAKGGWARLRARPSRIRQTVPHHLRAVVQPRTSASDVAPPGPEARPIVFTTTREDSAR